LKRYYLTYIADTWITATRLADLVSHILTFNLTIQHAANDWEIPWEEDYRSWEAALTAGKAVAAAEGGEVSDFLLVVEDRLSDLRRGLYAGNVLWTDDGRGRWQR
jgi:hypothetical protein